MKSINKLSQIGHNYCRLNIIPVDDSLNYFFDNLEGIYSHKDDQSDHLHLIYEESEILNQKDVLSLVTKGDKFILMVREVWTTDWSSGVMYLASKEVIIELALNIN